MSNQLPAGWYTTDAGLRRYWTGHEWLTADPPPASPTVDGSVPAANEPTVLTTPTPRTRRGRKWILIAIATLVVAVSGVVAWRYLHPSLDESIVAECKDVLRDQPGHPSETGIVFRDMRVLEYEVGFNRYVAGMIRKLQMEDPDEIDGLRDALNDAIMESRGEGGEFFWANGEIERKNGLGETASTDWLCLVYVVDDEVSEAEIAVIGDAYLYLDPAP